MAQRVFVTGGTGFVGRHVIRALLARGFLVRCLVRPGSEHDLKGFESIDRVPGDVLQDIRATEKPVLVVKQGTIVRGAD